MRIALQGAWTGPSRTAGDSDRSGAQSPLQDPAQAEPRPRPWSLRVAWATPAPRPAARSAVFSPARAHAARPLLPLIPTARSSSVASGDDETENAPFGTLAGGQRGEHPCPADPASRGSRIRRGRREGAPCRRFAAGAICAWPLSQARSPRCSARAHEVRVLRGAGGGSLLGEPAAIPQGAAPRLPVPPTEPAVPAGRRGQLALGPWIRLQTPGPRSAH